MAKEHINCSVKKKNPRNKTKSNFVHENEIRTPPATNGLVPVKAIKILVP